MKQFCPKEHDTFIVGRDSKSTCKQCVKEYKPSKETIRKQRIAQRRWHLEHPEATQIAFKKCWQKKKQERDSYLSKIKSLPCMDCGKQYPPICMDFDHRDRATKINSISKMGWNSLSLKRIKEEISKCDLVCSNCHRIRTYNQFNLKTYGTITNS